MLLTSSLTFHSSSYLFFALQLNIGCFMMGLLILSPALSCLDVMAVGMVWIATLAASATACVMNSFGLFVCLPFLLFTGFLQFVYESAYMRLPYCCHLFLLTLPNSSLPYVLQSAFLRLLIPGTM